VLDPNDTDWLNPDGPTGPYVGLRSVQQAALWSWSPTGDSSLDHLAPERTWQLVSEAKYRVRDGRQWLLACASRGLAVVVSYPSGEVSWAGVADGNPHTMELLPDGNVAIAASETGFVRVCTASQGPRSTGRASTGRG
jgi:hypothetical protein